MEEELSTLRGSLIKMPRSSGLSLANSMNLFQTDSPKLLLEGRHFLLKDDYVYIAKIKYTK